MDKVNTLILGGGISGIAFSHFYPKYDSLIIEKTDRLGGLCKSFKVGDSIFDYSGHFLHFKNPEIRKYIEKLIAKHATGKFKTYERKAGIVMTDEDGNITKIIDYPFQANIHQLDKETFIDCLTDLWESTSTEDADNFEELARRAFGNKITDIFFKPYNEKLYWTKLKNISADGMKRFIPKVAFDEVIENFKTKKEFGYNNTFLYSPTSGIEGLVDAFIKEKPVIASLNETVLNINLQNKIVTTDKRTITYETLVSTLPLNLFTKLTNQDDLNLRSVDVNVYNITYEGDASPIIKDKCWVYVPDKQIPFYRVGYYNHMSSKKDTSIYVEVSTLTGTDVMFTLLDIDSALKKHGFIFDDAKIKDSQRLLMSPAYSIIEKNTVEKVSKYRTLLQKHDVYLTGRYSTWDYQSIEDNISDARELANKLALQ